MPAGAPRFGKSIYEYNKAVNKKSIDQKCRTLQRAFCFDLGRF